ncbi:SDR family oxidoreductase [Micromonospora sp. BRA006-A]|nr:SDR family oxidoreductase [Micromonospora sp. BRA006-A]
MGRDGVTVNVLAPGGVRTPPMERAAARLAGADGDVEAPPAMGHHSAVGRLARPEEVAAVAASLAGERASYVTAGVHLIDGGAAATGPDLPHLTGVRKAYA